MAAFAEAPHSSAGTVGAVGGVDGLVRQGMGADYLFVFLEPLFSGARAFPISTLREGNPETVTITGNLCTAADIIAEDITLPRLAEGDGIVIGNAGAYAATLSPFAFSSLERPKEFLLKETGDLEGV